MPRPRPARDGDRRPAAAAPHGARPLVLLLLLLSWAALGCGEDPPPPPLVDLTEGRPDVLILAIDTLRADHLGSYGNEEIRTPHLDAFAEEAILFEDAASPSTWTLPSFASLYTGLEPHRHGTIAGTGQRLPEHLPSMPQILRSRGYTTTGIVAVDYLSGAFGMARGYQRFAKYVDGPVSIRLRRYAGRVKGLLTLPPREDWFTLVHYFDVHDPYLPPQPFDRMYYDGDPTRLPDDPSRRIDVVYSDRNRVAAENKRLRYRWLEGVQDLLYPVRQYAAGVSFVDGHLGEVLELLRERGHLDRSIVVILSDHGEHLTEHDIYFTHRLPYAECLQVPLMIRLPGGVEGGRRVSAPVSLVDVLPTLMELIGEPLETPVDGISLVRAMRGEELPERLLFAEYGSRGDNWAKAVWDEDWRYVESVLDGERRSELFDRRRDPRETLNLVDRHPEVASRFSAALDDRFGAERRLRAEGVERTAEAIDPEVEARLRALGYID